MPFINDKLAYYQHKQIQMEADEKERELAEEQAKKNKKIPSRFTFDPDEVMKKLSGRIYGQSKALKSIGNMLKIVKADISDPTKPLYIGLFLGPTGVGKTELVKVLAEAIHGSQSHFCRVDMNTLSLDHYAAALTGSPPGYVGSKEGSTILEKEKIEGTFSKPGIILFDEMEKASLQVIQTLLNVFDNGMMTISTGEQSISFRNTIIFMTSNLGAKEMYQMMNSPDSNSKLEKIVKEELENSFSPEFINRIDDIITFNWLEQNVIYQIVDTYVEQMNKRLQKYNCQILLDLSAKEFIMQKGFDKRYGGRALKRVMRQYIEIPLAETLMEHSYDKEKRTIFTGQRSEDQAGIVFIASIG